MESTVEEQQAITRLRQGDVEALGYLVQAHWPRALRAAYLVTGDRAMAEDVVQEAFLRAYRRIDRFDGSRPFAPWLGRIVARTALDVVRSLSGHDLSLSDDAGVLLGTLPDPSPTPDVALDQSELRREVWDALARLSARQRVAIVMRYYLDLSEEEMAIRLAVPPGTVKSRLHAARDRLKLVLGPVIVWG